MTRPPPSVLKIMRKIAREPNGIDSSYVSDHKWIYLTQRGWARQYLETGKIFLTDAGKAVLQSSE